MGDILSYLIWTMGRIAFMNQQASAVVTAWHHGHGALHSNQLVALTLAG